ncbi:DUF2634 domain-containing protein [Clostridium sp. UBA6640]|uniref:DUF2634 domain-containing protein n=1 Tax=Clostridium sp. UBA6640 TaxID=1946370 RepID=UPI0025C529EA|nr:DUF2634 domain-containing protein [Clostridium sp. UBA6640]
MSIFPTFTDEDIKVIEEVENELNINEEIPREYAWDFQKNEFILKDGKFVVVEGIEALNIWIRKALITERYRYLAYTTDYGSEIESLVGKNYSKELTKSEIKRFLKEALEINPHIKGISDIDVLSYKDKITVNFKVETDLGEVKVSV